MCCQRGGDVIKILQSSSNANSFYYCPGMSNGTGIKESPLGWLENSSNSGRKVSCEISVTDERKWYYIKLKKGVPYEFFTIMDWYYSPQPIPLRLKIYRFDDLNNCILEIPYTTSGNYNYYEEGYSARTKFTTEHTCMYYIEVCADVGYYYNTGTAYVCINYTPEIVNSESSWKRNLFKINGSGWNKFGKVNNYRSTIDAGISNDYKNYVLMYKYVKCSFDITPT